MLRILSIFACWLLGATWLAAQMPTLTGQLTYQNGGIAAGKPVFLYGDSIGVRFNIATVTTNPNGVYSYNFSNWMNNPGLKIIIEVIDSCPGTNMVTEDSVLINQLPATRNFVICNPGQATCSASFIVQLANPTTNNTFTFNASGSSGVNVFQFNFGDGSPVQTVTTPTVTHTYAAPGTYQACLSANSTVTGCQAATFCSSVVVQGSSIPCQPTVTLIDSNQTVLAVVQNAPTGAQFSWNWGDGNSSTSSGSTSHPYNAPGTYTVYYAMNVPGTNCFFDDTLTVVITGGGINPGCGSHTITHSAQGLTANFAISSLPNTVNFTYQWILPNGVALTGPSPSHTFPAAGTYTVQVFAFGPNNCVDTLAYTVTISGNPNPGGPLHINGTVSHANLNVLLPNYPLQVNLFVPGQGPIYLTVFTDTAGYFHFDLGPYFPTASFTAGVGVQIKDLCGVLIYNNQHTLNQLPLNLSLVACGQPQPPCPPAHFSWQLNSNTGVVQFIALGATNTMMANTVFQWSFGNGATATGPNPSQNFAPGTYTVVLTVTRNLPGAVPCVDSTMQVITVGPTPGSGANQPCTASFYQIPLTYLNPATGVNTGHIAFHAQAGGSYTNWSMHFGNGSSTSGTGQVTQIVHSYSQPGTYLACLAVWNANTGCQASFCDSVVVLPAPTVPPAPVTISGNVSFGGISPADFATVYLIAGDTGLLSLTLVDSVNLTPNNMGNYTFANVPAGTYLVKAALRTNSVQYANRVPTYYGNSATWLYAMPVVAPGGATLTGINIPLIAGNNPGGPGFVGGSVLNGANKNLMVNLSPANQLIMLMDAQTREVVAFTRTDANGQYSLNNLPHGVYYLRLEVMGLQTEEQLIILTADEDQLTDVDFNDLVGITSRIQASSLQGVALYPNPATERTTLRFEQTTGGATELVLVNQLGQVVYQQTTVLAAGTHSLQVPVAQLPAGLYLYRLTAADGSTAQGRFIRADR